MFHFRVKAGSLFNSHHGNHIYTNGSHSSLTRCFTSSTLHYRKVLSKDQHHDVASYIAYAERTGLDVESKVFVGTHYEYSIASALRPLGFDLRRTGGQSDKGIDLLGTWSVPSMPENFPLQVLLQCKAYSTARSSKIGPQLIRELEGACLGAPYGWRGVGLLVSQRPASKGVREAMGQSRWPLGYVSCSTDGVLQQMIWNQRAEEEGLEGMGVTVKLSEEDRQGDTQRLILIWEGRPYLSPTTYPVKGPEDAEPLKEFEADTESTT